MKRMYIGIGLLAALLVVGMLLTWRFAAAQEPVAELLEQAGQASAAGDWEKAGALTDRARLQWEKNRAFTASVADHGAVEQIDVLFARLELLQRLEDRVEFSADCAELARLTAAMAASQRLRWWNLL